MSEVQLESIFVLFAESLGQMGPLLGHKALAIAQAQVKDAEALHKKRIDAEAEAYNNAFVVIWDNDEISSVNDTCDGRS